MRFLVVIGMFLALSGGAWATVSFLPPQYQQQQAKLAPSCGSERAYVIAALNEDIDIHRNWADIVSDDPSQAKVAGDVHWHRNWIQIYQRAVKLLKLDCSSPAPSR